MNLFNSIWNELGSPQHPVIFIMTRRVILCILQCPCLSSFKVENLQLLRDAIDPYLNWCSHNLFGQLPTILCNLYQIIGHIQNQKRTWLIFVSYLSFPFLSQLCSELWRSQGRAPWGRRRIHFDFRQDFSYTDLSSLVCLFWPCFLLPFPFQHTFYVVFPLLSSIARQNHLHIPICTRILAGPRFLAGIIWIFKEWHATAVLRAPVLCLVRYLSACALGLHSEVLL